MTVHIRTQIPGYLFEIVLFFFPAVQKTLKVIESAKQEENLLEYKGKKLAKYGKRKFKKVVVLMWKKL
jgi:hypothetical protein